MIPKRVFFEFICFRLVLMIFYIFFLTQLENIQQKLGAFILGLFILYDTIKNIKIIIKYYQKGKQ